MAKAKSRISKDPTATEVSTSLEITGVKANDLLGLGEAAKSPAAHEIARSFSETLFGPLRVFLKGKAEASRMRGIANARLDVARLEERTAEVLGRTQARFLAQEVRREVNLEATVQKAIEYANESKSAAAETIPSDWFLRWSEGAQQADEEEVRQLWARLLASRAQRSDESMRPAILALLAQMDAYSANAFVDFICELMLFRCLPTIPNNPITQLSWHQIGLLEEMGLVKSHGAKCYDFGWMTVTEKYAIIEGIHPTVSLSLRGHALANALFGGENLGEIFPEKFANRNHVPPIAAFVLQLHNSGRTVDIEFLNSDRTERLALAIAKEQPARASWGALIAPILDQAPALREFLDLLSTGICGEVPQAN